MDKARETPIHWKELDQTPRLRQQHDGARGWPSCSTSICSIAAPVDLPKLGLSREGHERPPGLAWGWVGELQSVQDLAPLAGPIGYVLNSHCCDFLARPHWGHHTSVKELLHLAW